MVNGSQNNIMPNQDIISYEDSTLVLEVTAGVDKYIFSNVDVSAKVCVKRGKHIKRAVNVLPGNFKHDSNNFRRGMIVIVQLHGLF